MALLNHLLALRLLERLRGYVARASATLPCQVSVRLDVFLPPFEAAAGSRLQQCFDAASCLCCDVEAAAGPRPLTPPAVDVRLHRQRRSFPSVWRLLLDAEVDELSAWLLHERQPARVSPALLRCHYDVSLCVRDTRRGESAAPTHGSPMPVESFDAEWRRFVQRVEAAHPSWPQPAVQAADGAAANEHSTAVSHVLLSKRLDYHAVY